MGGQLSVANLKSPSTIGNYSKPLSTINAAPLPFRSPHITRPFSQEIEYCDANIPGRQDISTCIGALPCH